MTKLRSNFFLLNLLIYTVILNDAEFAIKRETTNVKILHDFAYRIQKLYKFYERVYFAIKEIKERERVCTLLI